MGRGQGSEQETASRVEVALISPVSQAALSFASTHTLTPLKCDAIVAEAVLPAGELLMAGGVK